MKLLVREMARERRIPVLMETSDRGVLDVERFDLEPDRPIFHGLLGPASFLRPGRTDARPRRPRTCCACSGRQTCPPAARPRSSSCGRSRHRMATARQRGHARRRHRRRRRPPDRLGRGAPLGPGPLRRRRGIGRRGPGRRGRRVRDGTSGREAGPVSARRCRPDRCHRRCRPLGASGGNIQPWRFEADANEIRMYLVPERTTTMDVGTPGQLRRDRRGPLQRPRRRRRAEEARIDPPVPRGIPVPPRRHVAGRIIDRLRDRPPPASPTDAGGQPPDRRPLPHRRRGRPTAGSGCRTGRGPVAHPHRPRSHGDLRRSAGRVRPAPLPHPRRCTAR